MGVTIRLTAGDIAVGGELTDSVTARAIAAALPFTAAVNTWGAEIYLTIPVQATLDDTAQEVVAAGDIGYWPPGQALCLFFGPTPISQPGEIRPASAVNIVGRLSGDIRRLHEIRDGIIIKVERILDSDPPA